jgi:aminoglycoside phosphotransferase (APT) family kinase protein
MAEPESYNGLEAYPGPEIPGLERVAAWLDANRPVSWRPGIMHGDFHLANLMYAFDGPRLAAIVDWEMCTIGDPLLDLGWLLATWPDGDGKDLPVPSAPRGAPPSA